MITIFHAPMSRSTRILWLLEELGASYEVRPVSILRPDGSGGPDPANPHPLRQVPVIRDDGQVIVETAVITMHLADRYGAGELAPAASDPGRPSYIRWIAGCVGVLDPMLTARAFGNELTERHEQAREELSRAFHRAVGEQPYLCGERFTAADLMWFSYLRLAPDFLGHSAQLSDWLQRISERPALARARARDGALHTPDFTPITEGEGQ